MGCTCALFSLAQHHRGREIFPWYNRTSRRVARIWPSSSGGILSTVVWTPEGLLETGNEVFTFSVSSEDASVPILCGLMSKSWQKTGEHDGTAYHSGFGMSWAGLRRRGLCAATAGTHCGLWVCLFRASLRLDRLARACEPGPRGTIPESRRSVRDCAGHPGAPCG